ncbi:helix-turn-helix transcriptional regulator [Sphingosinicella soli]|uniref:DNA-binding protein n=1 Tax=Sphingosinicella soli TaxID=333708 RepID=A0A7W7B3N9_9SPHN|nr:DNA-binding protein [Sphingosinicella soli]MBB4632538.1 hypothetical protein [Sphingosinicella soli]
MSENTRSRVAAISSASPFLNTRQAAHYLCVSVRHLERQRRCGAGPRFRRHGRFVFYHIDDIDSWSRASAGAGRDGRGDDRG